MPAFTSTQPALQQDGPVVRVMLGLLGAAEDALRAQNVPVPQPLQVTMMVDTDASGSVIAPGLAQQLGLQPVNVQQISTPSTTAPVPMPVTLRG